MEKAVFKKEKKQRNPITVQTVIKYTIFVLFLIYSITLVFPFLWMFMNSFKSSAEFFQGNIWGFPKSIKLSNYYNVFFGIPTSFEGETIETSMRGTVFGISVKFNIFSMFGISLLLTVCQTFVSIFVTASTAYVIAKYKFFGRNAIFNFAVFLMIVPIVGTLPSQYRLMRSLGLVNNPLGLIIMASGAFGMSFFLMYGFFKSISWNYAEAAFVDGAGHTMVYFRIMLPIAFPAMIALSIIYAIGVWNDYVTPALYMKNIPTLAVGLRYVTVVLRGKAAYPEMFAALIIALLPVMTLFIIFQKTIMQNTIAGGLKG